MSSSNYKRYRYNFRMVNETNGSVCLILLLRIHVIRIKRYNKTRTHVPMCWKKTNIIPKRTVECVGLYISGICILRARCYVGRLKWKGKKLNTNSVKALCENMKRSCSKVLLLVFDRIVWKIPYVVFDDFHGMSVHGFYCCCCYFAILLLRPNTNEQTANRETFRRFRRQHTYTGMRAFDVFTVERAQKLSMRTTQLWAYQTRHVSNTGSAVSRGETSWK